jgi:hypothetical protein
MRRFLWILLGALTTSAALWFVFLYPFKIPLYEMMELRGMLSNLS